LTSTRSSTSAPRQKPCVVRAWALFAAQWCDGGRLSRLTRNPGLIFTGLTTAAAITGALAGVLAALGLFTFDYAKGFSYLSTDPGACANCHIMQPQFATEWR